MRNENGKARRLSVAFATIAILAAAALGSGCGELQKAIDEMTTQNVDFYQGIYDGSAERAALSVTIVSSAPVSMTGPAEAGVMSTYAVLENAFAVDAGVEETTMSLSGAMQNTAGADVRAYVFFAPSSTPAESEAVMIGSMPLTAGETREFAGSEGFDQSPAEVEAAMADYFMTYFDHEDFYVFMYSEGSAANPVIVNELNIDSTPTFTRASLIPANLIGNQADNVRDIVTVAVEGRFMNNGAAPAHFVWVVGSGTDTPTVGESLVIDLWLEPGSSANASDGLVVPAGLRLLKNRLKNLVDGESANGSLIATSTDTVNVTIDGFKVTFVAEIGL